MSTEPASTPTAVDEEVLMETCLTLALQLRTAVRMRRRDRVAEILARVPDGRLDVLAIAAAAMLPSESSAEELLEWTRRPVTRQPGSGRGRPQLPREHGTERGYFQHRAAGEDGCPDCRAAHSVEQRPQICRDEFRRLVRAGVPVREAAAVTTLPELLARRAKRSA